MILTKYLTKELFKSQIAILFILLLIFFCQQLVRVLGSAVNGNIPTDLVVSLLLLGMPTMAQLMLPLSLFIAILLTLGKLYAESEITAMQACGAGKKVLVHTVLLLALFTGLLATYNSLWLSPWAIKEQGELIENAKSNPNLSALVPGQFISSPNGDYILFVNQVERNQAKNIYIFQTQSRDNIKPSVVVAERGELASLPNNEQVLNLTNSQRYEGSAILPDFRITHFEKYQAYIGYNTANNEDNNVELLDFNTLVKDKSYAARAELNWRITLILAVPIMALIAVAMSKVNPRQGRFAKMLPALLIYLIYFLLQSSLKSAGFSSKVDAGVLMPIVNLFFLLLAIVLNNLDSTFMQKLKHKLISSTTKTQGA